MRKIVARDDLPKVIANLNELNTLVWDVETTGLNPYHSARMFSVAIADLNGNSWYFNFQSAPDIETKFQLSFDDVKPIFDRRRLWIGHNAKFDLHFCAQAGICPNGEVADTRTLARLHNNNLFGATPYSLAECAKRWLDVQKDDRVKQWMDENYAYRYEARGGRKNYMFDLVPFPIISEYAMIDAEVTAKLYQYLKANCAMTSMWETENYLTKVLFHMEHRGFLVDQAYVHDAKKAETLKRDEASQELCELIDEDWVDSAKCLVPFLKQRGFDIPKTEKGFDEVSDKVLNQKPEDPLAKALLKYRDANKRSETYWANYQILPDESYVIHPDLDQAGTVTSRLSCRKPNLQNIPSRKDEFSAHPIRRAFKARDGYTLVSIDYKAVEFRLALEFAGELEVIERIKAGEDPHTATAEKTGLSRPQAKTLNFMLIYGGGPNKIAPALNCSLHEASIVRRKYFDGMPNLERFIKSAQDRIKQRGWVQNAFERRYHYGRFMYQGQMKDNAYKAPNLIIQGTAADVMKRAMVSVSKLLEEKKSAMLLSIHDELIIEVHMDEFGLIPEIAKAMTEAYPHKYLPLECSIEVGPNLFDMEADE